MREFSVFVDSDSVCSEALAETLQRGGLKPESFEIAETAPHRTKNENRDN
jgi:hypothetical protein